MKLNKLLCLSVALLFCSMLLVQQSSAQDAAGAVMPLEFNNAEQRQRYQHFSKILRCPMCQNQNLSGSDAGIASDLRKTLHRLIGEDKTDQEIIDFMQSRYGNFILYEPPMNQATFLLWFGPLLLLVGGVLIARQLTSRGEKALAAGAETAPLSEQEKQRARDILTTGNATPADTNKKNGASSS